MSRVWIAGLRSNFWFRVQDDRSRLLLRVYGLQFLLRLWVWVPTLGTRIMVKSYQLGFESKVLGLDFGRFWHAATSLVQYLSYIIVTSLWWTDR